MILALNWGHSKTQFGKKIDNRDLLKDIYIQATEKQYT